MRHADYRGSEIFQVRVEEICENEALKRVFFSYLKKRVVTPRNQVARQLDVIIKPEKAK